MHFCNRVLSGRDRHSRGFVEFQGWVSRLTKSLSRLDTIIVFVPFEDFGSVFDLASCLPLYLHDALPSRDCYLAAGCWFLMSRGIQEAARTTEP